MNSESCGDALAKSEVRNNVNKRKNIDDIQRNEKKRLSSLNTKIEVKHIENEDLY